MKIAEPKNVSFGAMQSCPCLLLLARPRVQICIHAVQLSTLPCVALPFQLLSTNFIHVVSSPGAHCFAPIFHKGWLGGAALRC